MTGWPVEVTFGWPDDRLRHRFGWPDDRMTSWGGFWMTGWPVEVSSGWPDDRFWNIERCRVVSQKPFILSSFYENSKGYYLCFLLKNASFSAIFVKFLKATTFAFSSKMLQFQLFLWTLAVSLTPSGITCLCRCLPLYTFRKSVRTHLNFGELKRRAGKCENLAIQTAPLCFCGWYKTYRTNLQEMHTWKKQFPWKAALNAYKPCIVIHKSLKHKNVYFCGQICLIESQSSSGSGDSWNVS